MVSENRLQVGLDVGKDKIDLALLSPGGEMLVKHRSFANSALGYSQASALLQEVLRAHAFEGVDIAAEATSYYWLPFFYQLCQDPSLAVFQPRQLLLNAGWVKWFKKSMPADHKSDSADPYYVGERLRSLPVKNWWQSDGHWLALRLLTRLHSHLSKSLVREKSYYQLFLFLTHSAYTQAEPFSDPFGVVSQSLLNQPELLEELGQLPELDLAARLDQLSAHRLPDPRQTAARLKQALQESFPMPAQLQPALQDALQRLSRVVQTLQQQIKALDAEIGARVKQDYPEASWLQSIPGVGPVSASGIAAEIAGLQRFTDPLKWDNRRNAFRQRTQRNVEDAVAKFAGLWWPKNASGQFEAEERPLSKRGNAYLRYYLIQAADHMRREIPSYARYYQRKYAQVTKHQHKRALVLTARKAVGLFVGLLHHREDYRLEEDLSRFS
jgi:hypothetical protein